MSELCLVPIGSVPPQALGWIENAAAEWFPLPTRRLPGIAIPDRAYDARRGQYQSVEFMKTLAQCAPRDAFRVLGITDVDLSIPMLSFLFGQSQFDGPIASGFTVPVAPGILWPAGAGGSSAGAHRERSFA